MISKGLGIAVVFIWLCSNSWAQELKPVGKFQQDSVKIGMSIPYSLSLKYPKSMDVVFPDSLHDYSPFEYESRTYFPTKSDSIFSYDSAVYYISTFEIDNVQFLSLPVLVRNKRDSVTIFPEPDSVILIQLIQQLPDSVQLIENTSFLNTPLQFNYPYYIIGLIIIGVSALVALLIFGGTIRRKLLLRRLNKKYLKFIEEFDQMMEQLSNDNSNKAKEGLLIFWKSYLEKLEKKPYTKLTSKELVQLHNENEELKFALQNIDKAIYGNISNSLIDGSFAKLKAIATKKYHEKVNELNSNG